MSVSKKYLKSRPDVCRVAFKFDGESALNASRVCLAGDFNDWDTEATPMTQNKHGFECSMDLSAGRQYKFKYVIDGQTWCNDPQADSYEYSGIGDSMNSVISI